MIEVKRVEFVKAMKMVGLGVDRRKKSEGLLYSHVLLRRHGGLLITGWNGDILVSAQVSCRVSGHGDDAAPEAQAWIIPYRAVMDLLKAGGDIVTITRAEAQNRREGSHVVEVKTGNAKSVYPEAHTVRQDADGLTDAIWLATVRAGWDGQLFREALERILPAASVDDARPVLCAVTIEVRKESALISAADGFRMARTAIPCGSFINSHPEDFPAKLIVPRTLAKAVTELAKIAKAETVSMRLGHMPAFGYGKDDAMKQAAFFQVGPDVSVCAPLVEGTYPDLTQVIPHKAKLAIVAEGAELGRVLQNMGKIHNKEWGTAMRLSVPGAGNRITATLPESEDRNAVAFEASLPATPSIPGADILIGFNLPYLAESVAAAGKGKIKIEFTAPNAPVKITGPNRFLAVIMPMHLG